VEGGGEAVGVVAAADAAVDEFGHLFDEGAGLGGGVAGGPGGDEAVGVGVVGGVVEVFECSSSLRFFRWWLLARGRVVYARGCVRGCGRARGCYIRRM
jgi:hypothetical protein